VNSLGTARGHVLAGIGGLGLIIAMFLEWTGARDAWMDFTVVDILMTAIGAVAVLYAVMPALGTEPAPGLALLVAAAGMAVFGLAISFAFEFAGTVGVWVAVLSSAAIAFGSYDASRHLWTPKPRPSRRTRPAAPPPRAPRV
jgi:hypothetical protein